MLNLKSFERFENEDIYIPVDVHNQLTEGTHFGEDVFKKIINFTNQNVLIIGCPDFKKELGPQKSIVCINFDDIIEDKDSLNVDLKLFKTFDGKNDMSSTVTSSILKYLKGKTFDKIFNFSIVTGEATLNYELVAKFNQWIFEHYFIQGLTSWYSFDEADVQNQFETLIGEKKKGKKKIYTGYKVNTLGVFNKDVWKSYGFEDGSERILTRVVSDKTETYKTAQELEDEESTSGAEKIDTGDILRGVVEPSIYTFDSPSVNAHIGGSATKVGDTSREVNKRMEEWKHVFPDLNLIKSYSAVVRGVDDSIDGRVFRDHSIHKILGELGYYNLKRSDFPDRDKYSHEFFKDIVINDKQDDVQTAIDMFYDALRDHRTDIIAQLKSVDFHKSEFALPTHDKDLPYKERDLQTDTINNFKRQIAAGDKEMLMYAVMRFGKTFTACRCAQEMPNNRFTVIVSAKADVKYEWVDQVNPYREFENYDMYFVKGDIEGLRKNLENEYEDLDAYLADNPEKHIMLFITLQDLDGYTKGKKNSESTKNFNFFQKTHIDLLIIDEAHYGAQGKSYGLGIQEGDNIDEEGKLNAKAKELIENALTLDNTVKLHLSGTPYDLVARGKFSPDSTIASFGFDDLIQAKKDWNKAYGDFIAKKQPVDRVLEDGETPDPLNGKILTWEDNPYFGIPDMKIFGYNFDEFKLKEVIGEGTVSCASLLRLGDDTYKNGVKKFLYEDDILHMFKGIDGSEKGSAVLPLLDLPAIKKGNMCKHIVIVLPHTYTCDTMEEFLREHQKKDLKNLKNHRIINIAGKKHGMSTADAKKEIAQQAEAGNKTISLTVKQMLTGVTVKEWDTMFYLKDGESPQEFDQARFRVQTPYVKKLPIYEITDDLENVEIVKDENGDDKIVKIDMKPQTIFVDFALDRTYSIMYDRAVAQVDSEGEDPHPVRNEDGELEDRDYEDRIKEKIQKDLACIPIIAYNGEKLTEIEYENAYHKAVDIYNAKLYEKCGRNYLGFLENEIDWDELCELCKDIDMSDMETDYSGSSKLSGKFKGKMKKPGAGPGADPTNPGSRPPGGSSPEGDNSEVDDYFRTDNQKEFASRCNTMIRNILVYILCRNDDTRIETLNRLLDTMRTDESSGMEQNWKVAINIFDPKHSDETDIDEIKKYVKLIQKKIKKFIRILRRKPSAYEKIKKILFRAESDYKHIRRSHEGIKEVLNDFGTKALGDSEFIFKDNDIIKEMLKDVVIFKDKVILDCYGSKIGEIPHYLAENYKDFSLSNYYLICRTGQLAELSKVTLKIIMKEQNLDRIQKEDGKSRKMTQLEIEEWLNDHILIFDPTVKSANESVIEPYNYDVLNKSFETFSEFMLNEGKYTPEEWAEKKAAAYAKKIAQEAKRELRKKKQDIKQFENEGGIWNLKDAIEEKWGDILEDKDMKFDVIIGNPPYKGNLHLKIISTMLSFLSERGSSCFIHPARWIEDPLAELKDKTTDKVKFKNIVDRLEDVKIISSNIINGIFSTTFDFDCMISKIKANPVNKFKSLFNDIAQECFRVIIPYSNENNLSQHIEDFKLDGYRVDVKEISPQQAKYWRSNAISYRTLPTKITFGPYKDGYDIETGQKWTEKPGPKMVFEKGMTHSIEFSDENTASNFKNSCECNFYKNIIFLMKFDQHTPLQFLPWMKDYSHPWTDEDYCKFFEKLGMSEECQKWMCRDVYDYRVKDFIDYMKFDDSKIEEIQKRISLESSMKKKIDSYDSDYDDGKIENFDPDSSPSGSEPSKSPLEMTLEELKDNFKEDYEQWNDGEYEEDFETWLRKKYPGKFIEKNEEGED